jgi:hypothetical protein
MGCNISSANATTSRSEQTASDSFSAPFRHDFPHPRNEIDVDDQGFDEDRDPLEQAQTPSKAGSAARSLGLDPSTSINRTDIRRSDNGSGGGALLRSHSFSSSSLSTSMQLMLQQGIPDELREGSFHDGISKDEQPVEDGRAGRCGTAGLVSSSQRNSNAATTMISPSDQPGSLQTANPLSAVKATESSGTEVDSTRSPVKSTEAPGPLDSLIAFSEECDASDGDTPNSHAPSGRHLDHVGSTHSGTASVISSIHDPLKARLFGSTSTDRLSVKSDRHSTNTEILNRIKSMPGAPSVLAEIWSQDPFWTANHAAAVERALGAHLPHHAARQTPGANTDSTPQSDRSSLKSEHLPKSPGSSDRGIPEFPLHPLPSSSVFAPKPPDIDSEVRRRYHGGIDVTVDLGEKTEFPDPNATPATPVTRLVHFPTCEERHEALQHELERLHQTSKMLSEMPSLISGSGSISTPLSPTLFDGISLLWSHPDVDEGLPLPLSCFRSKAPSVSPPPQKSPAGRKQSRGPDGKTIEFMWVLYNSLGTLLDEAFNGFEGMLDLIRVMNVFLGRARARNCSRRLIAVLRSIESQLGDLVFLRVDPDRFQDAVMRKDLEDLEGRYQCYRRKTTARSKHDHHQQQGKVAPAQDTFVGVIHAAKGNEHPNNPSAGGGEQVVGAFTTFISWLENQVELRILYSFLVLENTLQCELNVV